jgi:WhiB family redox-sensing transcriptional regulator
MPALHQRNSAAGAGLGTTGRGKAVTRRRDRQQGPKEPTAEAAEQAKALAQEVVGKDPRLADLLGIEMPVVADLLGDAPEWQERALCAQTDPEAFFPEKGGSTREAKRICSRCEVRTDCLEYALGHDERFGIWGGLSERERRKLKRRAA